MFIGLSIEGLGLRGFSHWVPVDTAVCSVCTDVNLAGSPSRDSQVQISPLWTYNTWEERGVRIRARTSDAPAEHAKMPSTGAQTDIYFLF